MSSTPKSGQASSQPNSRRALIAAGALVALIGGLLALGKLGYLPNIEHLRGWMESLAQSPWGLPATVLVFCIACYLAVPQFALVALTVAVFGPWFGAAYSFVAYVVSGATTFWIGRWAGEEAFRRHAGSSLQKFSAFIGRNAFLSSAIVRIVPSGPFVLINTAFAISHAKFRDYIAGLALGVIPKIALIAFAGEAILHAISGNLWLAGAVGLGAVLILLGLNVLRRRLQTQKGQASPASASPKVDNRTSSPDR